MTKQADVLRFVVSLLPSALEGGTAHRTLVSFNTVILLDFLGRSEQNALEAGTLAMLVPALMAPLKVEADQRVTAIHRDAMVRSVARPS